MSRFFSSCAKTLNEIVVVTSSPIQTPSSSSDLDFQHRHLLAVNSSPIILWHSRISFLGFWIIVGTVAFILQKRKAASFAAVSGGQMGGQGKPNGPPQAANGHGPIGGHGQSMNNDFKVEIEQQMEAELADLMEQQAQENENGRNDWVRMSLMKLGLP